MIDILKMVKKCKINKRIGPGKSDPWDLTKKLGGGGDLAVFNNMPGGG